jgi:AcrR family transcriptional regulator
MASKETREKILEAALELFRERGFEETTMREIATRARVASGLAYYYFASKDAIVLAFYHRANGELREVLEPAHKEKRFAARLQAIIEPSSTTSNRTGDSSARCWRMRPIPRTRCRHLANRPEEFANPTSRTSNARSTTQTRRSCRTSHRMSPRFCGSIRWD